MATNEEKETPSEYQKAAPRMEALLQELRLGKERLSEERLYGIVASALGRTQPFNCYPGRPSKECHDLVVVLSLNAREFAGCRIDFKTALARAARHIKEACPGRTQMLVIYTDEWLADAWNDWQDELEKISRDIQVGTYLLTGSSAAGGL